MTDIFKEVDEALRYDRVAQFWQRFRFHIIGGLAFILIAAVGYTLWHNYDQNQRAQESEELLALYQKAQDIDANKPELIKEFDSFAEKAHKNYALLARLQQAALMAMENQKKEALEIYYKISQDPEYLSPYRSLALMQAGLLAQEVTDSIVRDHLLSLIEKVANEENNVWQPFAKELTALEALRQQDPAKAKTILTSLVEDANLVRQNFGIIDRATAVLMVLDTAPTEADKPKP